MNTEIINIDSSQFTDPSATFKLNTEQFNQIKNAVSIEISDVSFFYTSKGTEIDTNITTGGIGGGGSKKILTSSLKFSHFLYRFLTINDYERINYNSTTSNYAKYTCKLLRNENTNTLQPYPRNIEFKQPIDIGNLTFNWYKEDGTNPSTLADLMDNFDDDSEQRFTFTLTIKSLHNSTLKNYNEMFNFSPDVLQRLAYTKIIEDKKTNKDMTKDNKLIEKNYKPNKNEPTMYNISKEQNPQSLAGDYSTQTNNLNNQLNYSNNGNRINYDYNGFLNN